MKNTLSAFLGRFLTRGLFVSLLAVGLALGCGGSGDDGADSATDVATDSSTDSAGAGSTDIMLGTGSGTGSGGGQGGNPSVDDCGGTSIDAAPVVANVLFVIDRSGSMIDTPDGFTDSKWDTLVASLKTSVANVQDAVNMGLKLYPSGDTSSGACALESGIEVEVAAGADAVPLIGDELDAAGPDGQTPTAAALGEALDYFTAGAGALLDGSGFVVLATDGGPNCGTDDSCTQEACGCDPDAGECDPTSGFCSEEAKSCTLNLDGTECGNLCDGGTLCYRADQCLDDVATLAAVEALAGVGIKTIVVGMPGSEAYQEVLDALAVAGGLPAKATSPRYHQVSDANGLSQTLEDITAGVIRSCEIEAAEEPSHLTEVNVFLDGEVIPQDDTNGWKYGDTTGDLPIIVLTGSVCEQVMTEGVSSVSVEYGCPTVVR